MGPAVGRLVVAGIDGNRVISHLCEIR